MACSGSKFLTAHWDAGLDRWVGGAQDNDVQAGAPHSGKGSISQGFVFGDGTVTKIDNTQTPARLFGARQFLGSKEDDDRRRQRQRRQRRGEEKDGDEDEDIPPGLQFLQGMHAATGNQSRCTGPVSERPRSCCLRRRSEF